MPVGIKKSTKRLTLCAVLTALGVVVLSLGSLLEVLDLSAAALAGMLVVIVVIEVGGPFLVGMGGNRVYIAFFRSRPRRFLSDFAGYIRFLRKR